MDSGNLGTIITVVVVAGIVFFLLREALHIAFMVVGAVLVLAVLNHYAPGISDQISGLAEGAFSEAWLWVSQYLHTVGV
ncbi:hypothetical protein [Acidithiobacillus ferrooxidans]|jgi:hypothetical protein|uniref:hypothetical protein n=1 Tax=Acidithiobacillus ferrooxidans TaxID=920 RepID=UPI000A51482E|nr:hypothetical protein [Acidithiobacillus ferrooxidans]